MLVAVDTNVPVDLAAEVEDVLDAVEVIRDRIKPVRLIAPPTVILELAYLSRFAEEEDARSAAQTALSSLVRNWKIQPVNRVLAEHGTVEALAAKIRAKDLLPDEEIHDARILAESALLGCSILLTSDAHLRAVDAGRLSLLMGQFHLAAPIIATPREVVRKFM